MTSSNGPAEDRLREALAAALAAAGVGEPIELKRRRSRCRSTFPLEDLRVLTREGAQLRIACKRLEWGRLGRRAKLSTPDFLFDPAREPAVYASVLPLAPPGPPRYLGSVATDGGAGRWLFLEWVQGRELYQVGERSSWERAAGWLGRMHASLAPDLDRHVQEAGLLEHDAAHCLRWVQRACRFARADGRANAPARFLDRLANRYDAVLEALLELPRTVIHGDFYAANVLVARGEGGDEHEPEGEGEGEIRVAPVDWELAAAGPGLMDLAALISGDWSEEDRAAMSAAYAAAEGVAPFSPRELDLVRLHHAVQRLGWAPPDWQPPPAQRHDWLGEAIVLAEALEI